MDANAIPYQRLSIYQTKARLYIVGYCKLRGTAALLKISKQEPTQLDVAEVVGNYSLEEVRQMLGQIHMANAHLGGLQLVTHCCGIIGCFRFTETFYLLLVTRKAHVGTLCGGHKVYTVAATALMPLHPGYHGGTGSGGGGGGGQPSSTAEKRYVKLLMGMDLTKHFYFSYTYNLAHTVQWNCRAAQQRSAFAQQQLQLSPHSPLHGGNQRQASPSSPHRSPGPASASQSSSSVYDSMFTWNAYLTSAMRRALCGNERWTVPLIHGFWEQRRLSIYGRPLTLTLIARRSRHFAGTRYRKRGLNDSGKVANEVETEQVVDAGIDYRTRTPLLSSVVQVRGSVPLFWSQQLTALSPKPEIILQQFDPLYEVTEAHFDDLEARYGAPAVVLNLLKSKERRPREVLLRRELAAAIAQLNAQRGKSRAHIVYIPWDFSKHAKQSGSNLLNELAAITRLALDMTGLFVHNPASPPPQRLLLPYGPLSPLRSGSNGGSGGSGVRSIRTTPGGGGLRRSMGEGGSTMHLAAAAEAAAAAVKARNAAAAAAVAANPGRRPLSPHSTAIAAASPEQLSFRRTSAGGFSRVSRGYPAAASARSAASSTGGGFLSAVQWQSGVLRTNCIDCLDRTNVAQFAFGLVAFGRQLYKLGLHDLRDIDADSSAAFMLMGLYEAMGHVLSLQYGGSEAHTIFFQRKKGEWEAATQSKDLVTSIKRLYSNTYTDAEKQDAINLFLGNFVPHPNQPHLWQLDTDQYLHSETTARPTQQPAPAAGAPQRPGSRTPSVDGLSESAPTPQRTSSEHVPLAVYSPVVSAPATPHMPTASRPRALPDLTGSWAPAFPANEPSSGGRDFSPPSSITAFLSASGAAAAAAAAEWGSGARFPGLPAEAGAPLPLDVSSDDDESVRSRAYHEPGGADGGGGPSLSVSASAGSASSHYSAAIPFHRAPSSGGFLASLLPAFGGRGSAGSSSSGSGGGGLFERVVASLLQPGGAGAAARAAAAGVGGGDVPGGVGSDPARQLLSFDQALANPSNQIWPIRLHGEEDKQGRWAAVQNAFSFFWTTGSGNAAGPSGENPAQGRSKYQLDDAPRPPARPPTGPSSASSNRAAIPSPTGSGMPLSTFPSGFISLPTTPETSRHGGTAGINAAAASTVPRTVTSGTDGGISVTSDVSPRAVVSAAAAALSAVASASEGSPTSRSRHLGQVLDLMVDSDHMDGRRGRATACRTVADTIPALGGAWGAPDRDQVSRYGSADVGLGPGGESGGDDGDDDGAYYYSAADAEAVANHLDGAGGGAGMRQSVRTVAQMLGSALLSPSTTAGGAAGSGGGRQHQQQQQVVLGPGTGIPVLNDFIEVVGPGGGPSTDWRVLLVDEHALDPATRRRAAADAAARAREEERQRKLVTAGLEVSDMLSLGLEDLGINWELQPWWALEPRPRYEPRPHEPHPSRLRSVQAQKQQQQQEEEEEIQQQSHEQHSHKQAVQPCEAEQQSGPPGHQSGVASASLLEQQQQQQRQQQQLEQQPEQQDDDSGDQLQRKAAEAAAALAAAAAREAAAKAAVTAEEEDLRRRRPAAELLQQRLQVEYMAFLHYDVAQLHARAKFGDFLASIPAPYGLYGEEHRRDIAVYDSCCYIERL